MSQIEKNLTQNETIIAKAEISMLSLIPIIINSFVVCIIIGLSFFIPVYPMSYTVKPSVIATAVLVPTVLVTVLYTVKCIIVIKTTELAVTTKKIFGKLGVIKTKIMDAPLNKINNITVEQKLFGKIFGYGKIIITTSSGSYNYPYIKNADDFRRKVMNQIDIYDNERIRKQAEEIARSIANN